MPVDGCGIAVELLSESQGMRTWRQALQQLRRRFGVRLTLAKTLL